MSEIGSEQIVRQQQKELQRKEQQTGITEQRERRLTGAPSAFPGVQATVSRADIEARLDGENEVVAPLKLSLVPELTQEGEEQELNIRQSVMPLSRIKQTQPGRGEALRLERREENHLREEAMRSKLENLSGEVLSNLPEIPLEKKKKGSGEDGLTELRNASAEAKELLSRINAGEEYNLAAALRVFTRLQMAADSCLTS